MLTAARREQPDRVPRLVGFEGAVRERLCRELGIEPGELRAHFKNDISEVRPNKPRSKPDMSAYFARDDVQWGEWGRGRVWDESHHYAEYLYPLENAETVDEIEAYPWPDLLESYRYEGLDERVREIREQGFCVGGSLAETIFEMAWEIRSMDRLFEDILTGSDLATVLLDKITERRVATARAYGRAGIDLLSLGDDVAMQNGLMMSRDMFNTWFRPRLERVIAAAREGNPDMLVMYHSDGKVDEVIPDLIAAGVDILNPVQPECVDHRWVKDTFGDRLAFSGGLGVQSVLPFGTPGEVRQHVCEVIRTLGRGGGLIVGPSHIIERDTPTENILAMATAIDDFGNYN